MQIQPETIIWNQPSTTSKKVAHPAGAGEVFRLEHRAGDRINGSMPVWGKAATPEEEITAGLASATETNQKPPSFATALAETEAKKDESFGFLDLVDMVNPLQHLPLIGTLYRNITGDTIKPVSRVIGGAAFGGPIGAASGIVNALVQHETGKDVGENLIASIEGENTSPASSDTTIAVANLHTRSAYNS